MKKILTTILLTMPLWAYGQRIEKVHGTSVYEVSDNSNITLREAKLHAIEMAKANAIKDVFGELVASDAVKTIVEHNGRSEDSFSENTIASAKGDWLGDTKPPVVNVSYVDGALYFMAEVWGEAREIVQAKTDVQWFVIKESTNGRVKTSQLGHKEPFYISFQAPINGFLALYVVDEDRMATCLLPYGDGRFSIKGGFEYMLFDNTIDRTATPLWFTTNHERESFELVLLFSPRYFSKCVDKRSDEYYKLNTVNGKDFQSWLLRIQREDPDMVVQHKRVTVINKNLR